MRLLPCGPTLCTPRPCGAVSFLPRWRYWNRWLKSAEMASPTSLLSVSTTDNYTRLVLKNPKSNEPARGGSFVYISVPGALGTGEAHAMTVALRGAPPSSDAGKHPVSAPHEEAFTLYVKDLGAWTKALRRAASSVVDPGALLVDVDGFYSHTTSFNTMMKSGTSRVLVIAGGSGVTSLMGFIQVNQSGQLTWCGVFVGQRNIISEECSTAVWGFDRSYDNVTCGWWNRLQRGPARYCAHIWWHICFSGEK